MSLTIDNQTNWDGRDLRRLCARVIEHTDGVTHRTIEVKTSRARNKEWRWENGFSGVYRGRAYLNNTFKPIYMGVPKVEREVNGELRRHEFDSEQFARVLEHEILHNQGLRHGDMHEDVQYCRHDLRFDVSDITVSPRPTWESAKSADSA